ncbi:MAG: hypothetical protein P9L90_04625 [Candidatus Aadella gelida]|nr:hypothetical protein [Candidatus Aadella gelida]
MLSKIVGTLWMMLGAFWLIKPGSLKNRLGKKMSKKFKRIVYGFVLILAFLMVGSVMKVPGMLAKILGIVGMVMAVKAIMLITSKTSETVLGWWADKPIIVFRVWAGCLVVMGVLMLTV